MQEQTQKELTSLAGTHQAKIKEIQETTEKFQVRVKVTQCLHLQFCLKMCFAKSFLRKNLDTRTSGKVSHIFTATDI